MIAFLLCSLLLAASSDAARLAPALFPRGLLIDGNIVEIEEVPYVAIIQYDGRPICGGAIISEDRILTSAHCVMNKLAWRNYKVRVGSSSRNSTDGQHLVIRDIKLHESFAGIYESMNSNEHQVPMNDLAMIITEPMNFGAKSQSISLVDASEYIKGRTEALVTGWSKLNGSEYLTTKNVTIQFTSDCNKEYYEDLPAGQICASYPGPWEKVACLGDLGGPLVVDGRLAGILSWGNGCAGPYGWGVYTSISYYRDWIDNDGHDVYRLP